MTLIYMQVLEELKELTGHNVSPEDTIALNWHKWQPKVLPYASLLNKTILKELLTSVEKGIPNGIHQCCTCITKYQILFCRMFGHNMSSGVKQIA